MPTLIYMIVFSEINLISETPLGFIIHNLFSSANVYASFWDTRYLCFYIFGIFTRVDSREVTFLEILGNELS